jgi:hypothetical protein
MESQVNLPQVYTKELWAKCKNKHHKKYIGKSYLSWSQIESFNDKTGFNTGFKGEYEYLLKYFSGVRWPDQGWGQFGSEAEAYITIRGKDMDKLSETDAKDLQGAYDNFSDEEKEALEQIKPLGVFQDEVCYYVEELDIIVLGYIDDRNRPRNGKVKLLRDYKTKSENSKKDLHAPKKHQIEIYVLGLKQRGIEVQNTEYCIVERLGGGACFKGGGRESLTVGNKIWYEPYKIKDGRLEETHNMIIDTVKRVSSLFTTYQKFFIDVAT